MIKSRNSFGIETVLAATLVELKSVRRDIKHRNSGATLKSVPSGPFGTNGKAVMRHAAMVPDPENESAQTG